MSLVLFTVLLSASIYAANVEVKAYVPDKIVKDVPFDLTLSLNSQNQDVARIQLLVTSPAQNVLFSQGERGVLLGTSTVNHNLALENGKIWKYNIGPQGSIRDKSNVLETVFIVRGKASDDAQIILNPRDNLVALYPTGASLPIDFNVLVISPSASICSDGVVGYVDTNADGLKSADEVNEACDGGAEGCSADCTYVKRGYKATNCAFSSQQCVINKMEAKEYLTARLNALINGQCYPDCAHPEALYKSADGQPSIQYDAEGKLTAQQKFQLINQVIIAFQDFFAETVQQPEEE